jgi:hypothetical protein
VRSVANLTRLYARDSWRAATTPLAVHAHPYRLPDANHALEDLRAGIYHWRGSVDVRALKAWNSDKRRALAKAGVIFPRSP